jgi:hypothetical protein
METVMCTYSQVVTCSWPSSMLTGVYSTLPFISMFSTLPTKYIIGLVYIKCSSSPTMTGVGRASLPHDRLMSY